jgi:predicted nucleic acid-binding protein
MHDIVINTGPIIALTAATGTLNWLPALYRKIIVPYEVAAELAVGEAEHPESAALMAIADTIELSKSPCSPARALIRELDTGEASVIHTALELGISCVAIDEKAGRRVARLHDLHVTGSLGILIRARKEGMIPNLADCVSAMRKHGIWLSQGLLEQALHAVRET